MASPGSGNEITFTSPPPRAGCSGADPERTLPMKREQVLLASPSLRAISLPLVPLESSSATWAHRLVSARDSRLP